MDVKSLSTLPISLTTTTAVSQPASQPASHTKPLQQQYHLCPSLLPLRGGTVVSSDNIAYRSRSVHVVAINGGLPISYLNFSGVLFHLVGGLVSQFTFPPLCPNATTTTTATIARNRSVGLCVVPSTVCDTSRSTLRLGFSSA